MYPQSLYNMMLLQIQCALDARWFSDCVFNPFHECPSILERSKFGKILFKDKLPYDRKIPMKFLYVSVLSLLHSSYISSWCYLQNHIGFKLIWDVGRFMTICIFIFLQFELCNKSLKSLIQILTLSRHNVFYFLSGWKCVLFILIRQIL